MSSFHARVVCSLRVTAFFCTSMKKFLLLLAVAPFLMFAPRTAQAQAPSNDLFVNGWVLTGMTATTNGNSGAATREDGEPRVSNNNNIGGRTVWFVWTAPVSGVTRVNTAGSR